MEALERLFQAMPARTGVAFIVVQHLYPDFKSLTDELLARRTRIPIHRVEDGMEVNGDAIYLIPPQKDMILANGRLLLTDKDPTQFLTLPIDHFFRSLAREARNRAIAIVLSGTGSDGSRGIRDIHDASGLVIAQTAESAKFDGMSRSAIETGIVDYVLTPEEIPDALMRHIRHPSAPESPEASDSVTPEGINVIFRLQRDGYQIDFSHYKPETVTRRTERRLALNHSPDLEDYDRRQASDPEELNQLYKDLLIDVTRFFRDEEAFRRLEHDVIPGLVNSLPDGEEIRVRVAGCATGEEAYSLAILLREYCERVHRPIHVKVFATDVHRASLDFAGAGVYSPANRVGVSPARLERHFSRKADDFQVLPELRKLVVFAPHNILRDAPFTKLDLVSCRNLLIYFQSPSQQRILSLFHFGLKTGRTLFLGPSESPDELGEEFDTIDSRWKIYTKRRDVRLPAERRQPVPASAMRPRTAALSPNRAATGTDPHLYGIDDALLDEFMPPGFLVNEERKVVQTFSGANRFLRIRNGHFSDDLLDMVEGELRSALAGARAVPAIQDHTWDGDPDMLVLSRRSGERVIIPALEIAIEVLQTRANNVRLGIDAPTDVAMLRHEVVDRLASATLDVPATRKATHALCKRLSKISLALHLFERHWEADRTDEARAILADVLVRINEMDRDWIATQVGAATPAKSAARSFRMLVVEDDCNERELLAGLLQMNGCECDTAADGSAALDCLGSHEPPDVLLIDMWMPRCDGPCTVRKLRSNPRFAGIRVFSISSTSPDQAGLSTGPKGVDAWFPKPLNPRKLWEAIQNGVAPTVN